MTFFLLARREFSIVSSMSSQFSLSSWPGLLFFVRSLTTILGDGWTEGEMTKWSLRNKGWLRVQAKQLCPKIGLFDGKRAKVSEFTKVNTK